MRNCLLREAWTAAGNEPLLPPSPVAELGTVIHELLEAAGKGNLENGADDKIQRMWLDLVVLAEKRMAVSAVRRHQVPLSRSIPDYEVRRIRACRRAAEVAAFAVRDHGGKARHGPEHTGLEIWVESPNGQVGGYIDLVTKKRDGIVLSDYKSGSVMLPGKRAGPEIVRQAYKEQLILYAALYQIKCGVWPVRLELVPLHGVAVVIAYDEGEARRLLTEAVAFLRDANQRIADVMIGCRKLTTLASPSPDNCKHCLFRPGCHAYWEARSQNDRVPWPADVRGVICEMTRLRNGKVCMRVAMEQVTDQSFASIRSLTNNGIRHPLLQTAHQGSKIDVYGLMPNYRSKDYSETRDTTIILKHER